MSKGFASVIISSYNRQDLLVRSLASLREYTNYPHEIILHDDGSTSDTLAALTSLVRSGYVSTLILNPPLWNRGHGTAVNRAANMAEGDYIVKLNGDECFRPGWLTEAVGIMESFPEVDLLHLAHYTRPTSPEGDGWPWDWPDAGQWTLHRETRNGRAIRVVWVGPGCAFMVRRSAWEEKGPWQAHRQPHFGEDMEYRLRLCPMMRLLAISNHPLYPPVPREELGAHWEMYKDTPWLAAMDPPLVSYHWGEAKTIMREAAKTLKWGPLIFPGCTDLMEGKG